MGVNQTAWVLVGYKTDYMGHIADDYDGDDDKESDDHEAFQDKFQLSQYDKKQKEVGFLSDGYSGKYMYFGKPIEMARVDDGNSLKDYTLSEMKELLKIHGQKVKEDIRKNFPKQAYDIFKNKLDVHIFVHCT